MNATVWATIGSFFAIIIGLWKYFGYKREIRQKEAEKAKKDMENAKTNNSPSDFLDSFNRL